MRAVPRPHDAEDAGHRPDPAQGGDRALRAHARRRRSRAGVPLVEALESVAGATGNIVYEKAVHAHARRSRRSATSCNMAMKQVNLFPNMVVQMIAVGEEAGALDAMLFKVAEFYEAEVDNAVDALSSLLEPLIMVILGVLVGGMVIAHVPADLQARRGDLTPAATACHSSTRTPASAIPPRPDSDCCSAASSMSSSCACPAAGMGVEARQPRGARRAGALRSAAAGHRGRALALPALQAPAGVVREHPGVQLAGAARALPALPRADLDAVPAGRTADDAAGGRLRLALRLRLAGLRRDPADAAS